MNSFSVTKTSQKANVKCAGLGGCSSSIAAKKSKKVVKKPVSGIFKKQTNIEPTIFKEYYDKGDLPIVIDFRGAFRKVEWKAKIDDLDYNHYLPIFFHGLREPKEPYNFFADRGIDDLFMFNPEKILQTLPQLIIPIKLALSTKDGEIVVRTLKKLQKLAMIDDAIAEAMVPYYRQILPVFNLLRSKKVNIGDKIDYSQRLDNNIGDIIQQTLEIFEKHGGEDAYINIKYMIPTYESCMF